MYLFFSTVIPLFVGSKVVIGKPAIQLNIKNSKCIKKNNLFYWKIGHFGHDYTLNFVVGSAGVRDSDGGGVGGGVLGGCNGVRGSGDRGDVLGVGVGGGGDVCGGGAAAVACVGGAGDSVGTGGAGGGVGTGSAGADAVCAGPGVQLLSWNRYSQSIIKNRAMVFGSIWKKFIPPLESDWFECQPR